MKFNAALFFLIAAASQQAFAFAPATQPPASYRTAAVGRCWWCELIPQISVTKKATIYSYILY
jgi:hypothetical protein